MWFCISRVVTFVFTMVLMLNVILYADDEVKPFLYSYMPQFLANTLFVSFLVIGMLFVIYLAATMAMRSEGDL